MKRLFRLKLVLAALVLPLIVAGCFSSAPTRQGESDRSGSGSGQTGTEGRGSESGDQSSSDSTSGNRGETESSTSSPQSSSTEDSGATSGDDGNRDSSSDIQIATAGESSTDGSASDTGGDDEIGGATAERPEVSVAEALEGANAAVDAAAEAVAEAESTIARAKEEAESSGSGAEDSFDPWEMKGSADPNEAEAGEGQASPDSSDEGEPSRSQNSDTQEDSFDPFASYGGGAEGGSERSGPSNNSLRTADDAVAAARAALNRARRALITAAGTGSSDADAEAVQLAAAQAAMQAAAEAVIASAIAVLAASDAFADDSNYNAAEAEAAQEKLAEGIAMVVIITQRDMQNAAEALEATGELLAAAGSLIGMLGLPDSQEEVGGNEEDGTERVASLEKKLDQSLAVFDDRMESEGRSIGGSIVSDDSETAGLKRHDGGKRGSVAGVDGETNNGAVSKEDWINPEIKDRYEVPEAMERSETEEYVIAAGRAQDDDIVARQLREAAMAETDPELREALWKEYKNYKESLESGEAEANP